MVEFIDLQTNDHERRKVSISYSDKHPETCNLLGNLEHQTEFKRDDLIEFARSIIIAFEGGGF